MDLLTRTLDIEDEAEDLQDDIDEVEEQINERVDRANEIDPPQGEDEEDEMYQIRQEVAELEATQSAKRGYLEALNRAVEEWDGAEIVIRELSGAETRVVRAEAAKKAEEKGLENYTDDIHETMFLRKAVHNTPPGCPEPQDIGDLPNRLFDWVLSRANMLNSTGEFNMGNSSLRERMIDRKEESEDEAPEATP